MCIADVEVKCLLGLGQRKQRQVVSRHARVYVGPNAVNKRYVALVGGELRDRQPNHCKTCAAGQGRTQVP